jgi:hypothetical protein
MVRIIDRLLCSSSEKLKLSLVKGFVETHEILILCDRNPDHY